MFAKNPDLSVCITVGIVEKSSNSKQHVTERRLHHREYIMFFLKFPDVDRISKLDK